MRVNPEFEMSARWPEEVRTRVQVSLQGVIAHLRCEVHGQTPEIVISSGKRGRWTVGPRACCDDCRDVAWAELSRAVITGGLLRE